MGSTVLANMGTSGYVPARVIGILDQGNAYRIELLNDAKTNVFGPMDEDSFVKAA